MQTDQELKHATAQAKLLLLSKETAEKEKSDINWNNSTTRKILLPWTNQMKKDTDKTSKSTRSKFRNYFIFQLDMTIALIVLQDTNQESQRWLKTHVISKGHHDNWFGQLLFTTQSTT